jgi:amino acid transporter
LGRRNKRFNTPHNAVFASLIVIFVLIEFDFDDIVNMTNALSAFYQLLIFAAFIKLRYTHADLARPYKGGFAALSQPRRSESLYLTMPPCCRAVPGSIPMLILGLLIPTALLVYIAVDVFFTLAPAMIVVGVTLVGFIYARWKKFTRAQFNDLSLDG